MSENPLPIHTRWSYGVVLWEITSYGKEKTYTYISFMLTIGKSPYEDVPNADMLSHLQEDGRLPQPGGCTDTW